MTEKWGNAICKCGHTRLQHAYAYAGYCTACDFDHPSAEGVDVVLCPKFEARSFVIRTQDGYVGRTSIDTALIGDQPKAFAYTYDTKEEARRVAAAFSRTLIEEV